MKNQANSSMISKGNAYPYKHWLTSLALGPLLMMGREILSGTNNLSNSIDIYIMFVAFGLLFSLPVLALYVLLFRFLIRKTSSVLIIKLLLNVAAIAAAYTSIAIIDTEMALAMASYYSAAVVIGSLFYKIRTPHLQNT